eukprot:3145286-Pyramimonas_sp.AAC.1
MEEHCLRRTGTPPKPQQDATTSWGYPSTKWLTVASSKCYDRALQSQPLGPRRLALAESTSG